MKIRRFVTKEEDGIVKVIDLLTNEVKAEYSHYWRAEKEVNRLTSEADRNNEPIHVSCY